MNKMRKGISPVIASILLIGVTVFAAGGIFMFTQQKAGDLQENTATPRASIELEGAYENVNVPYTPANTCCSGEPGMVFFHKGGDTVSMNEIVFQARSLDGDGVCNIKTDKEFEWSSGEEVAVWGLNYGCTADGIWNLGSDQADNPYTESTGTEVSIRSGEKLEIRVVHQPSNQIIMSKETTAGYSKDY